MLGYHKKAEFKPYKIRVIDGEDINKLELMFLALQKVIAIQRKTGKKGVKVEGNKITYDELQGMLFSVHTYFSMQGAFTNRGVCCQCDSFWNSPFSAGQTGYCNGGKEKWCFDVCDKIKSEDE